MKKLLKFIKKNKNGFIIGAIFGLVSFPFLAWLNLTNTFLSVIFIPALGISAFILKIFGWDSGGLEVIASLIGIAIIVNTILYAFLGAYIQSKKVF